MSVPHVGIVFVHGIGQQAAGETLLDWSSKIIGLLIDARAIYEMEGDPVIDVELDPGPSGSRYIELQLPAATTKGVLSPEQHWVMTEAWWAERVRPPAFGEMAEWLGPRGAIRRIVMAMLPHRSNVHDPRQRPAVEVQPLGPATDDRRPMLAATRRRLQSREGRAPGSASSGEMQGGVKEDGELGRVYDDGPPNPTVDLLTDIGTVLLSVGAGLYFQAISALVLVLYGALRSVEKLLPIGPLKNGALTRPIDRFVLEWFGDVYVLLRDPAQAASVRGRLIEAIRDLEANACDPILVVAHSGGAIVSYMTLADASQSDLRVDRLITLGEGLNLAWRLTAENNGRASEETKRRYDRLYHDMLRLRPGLQWDDFWASQDPAPVGVLSPEPGLMADASLRRIKSHALWNRLAFREDHGSYWDNDEEFLIPLARIVDRNPLGARKFFDSDKDRQRSLRRRRRLTFLSVWRQLALVAPTAAIVASYAAGSDDVVRAGRIVAEAWAMLPGNEIVSGPITAIRDMQLRQNVTMSAFAEAGVWVIVVVLGLLTLVALVAPSERPVPWHTKGQAWYRPFNLFSLFLRVLPIAVAVPVVVSVVIAASKFMGGATAASVTVGWELLVIVPASLGVAGLAFFLLFARPRNDKDRIRRLRDGAGLIVTIVVLVVVAFLAIAPFVSVLVFEDVGTMVLGFLTIIAGFQILGRIGTWRWTVWDGRERVAVRTDQPDPKIPTAYPTLLRIFAQMVLLVGAVIVAFAAVVLNSGQLTLLAVIIAGIEVLLGVAVDVMDVARGARRDPNDAMARGQNFQ